MDIEVSWYCCLSVKIVLASGRPTFIENSLHSVARMNIGVGLTAPKAFMLTMRRLLSSASFRIPHDELITLPEYSSGLDTKCCVTHDSCSLSSVCMSASATCCDC